jgi:hypothetical protein
MATAAKQCQDLGGILRSNGSAAHKALAADPASKKNQLERLKVVRHRAIGRNVCSMKKP